MLEVGSNGPASITGNVSPLIQNASFLSYSSRSSSSSSGISAPSEFLFPTPQRFIPTSTGTSLGQKPSISTFFSTQNP